VPTAERPPTMSAGKEYLWLGGCRLDYRVVVAKTARSLRVRVGPNGIEVSRPANRTYEDVLAFMARHADWILGQVHRVNRLGSVRRPVMRQDEVLYRGVPTHVRMTGCRTRARGASIRYIGGEILVQRASESHTPVARSLENWFRRQARATIVAELDAITLRLDQRPNRVYVMGQRTKWGNCSPRRNLSFNWRLVLAPDFVLRYLVTHEAVHLVIPDHSAKFWLTVQSLCQESEKARRWLISRGDDLRYESGLLGIE
jgi:predicted metal-dependent hydrolase